MASPMLVKKALPSLNNLMETTAEKPSVEVYAGLEGLKTIFEDILRESKSFDCIASKTHLVKMFTHYFPQFVKRRKKQVIKVRLIADCVPLDSTAKYKILKKKFRTATYVYNDKIAMISLEEKEPIGIVIKDKNFVETQKMFFEVIWESI